MKPVDPLVELRKLVRTHKNQRAAAVALGVSSAYLNDILNGRRDFSQTILDKLGLHTVVVKK